MRESDIGWKLPPFYCPIESLIHRNVAELERRAIAWVDKMDLYGNETDRAWGIANRCTDLMCRTIPYGRDEPLLLFIEWVHWALALDDWHDSGSHQPSRTAIVVELSARIARALEAPGAIKVKSASLGVALEDLITRTWALTTPCQLRRFQEAVRDWLFGAAWMTGNTERGIMPTLNDYVAMRPSANGTRLNSTFSEIANDIDVPPEALYSAPVQAVTDVAGFIVSCDNDLFSYAKEDSLDTPEQNIVNVIATDLGCSPAAALRDAVALRDRTMTLFLRLRDKIRAGACHDLIHYLDGLGHYIAGCIRWMNDAPRYASPRNRHPLPVEGASYHISWRDSPSDPRIEAPPIPAAAWWWKQLED
ncbi:hypothetical protein GWC77_26845 [Paraburkholderia sp. NMBU_R16]|nr:hypothetical protein [Paraburkholderia sp. NMBU_R16]